MLRVCSSTRPNFYICMNISVHTTHRQGNIHCILMHSCSPMGKEKMKKISGSCWSVSALATAHVCLTMPVMVVTVKING